MSPGGGFPQRGTPEVSMERRVTSHTEEEEMNQRRHLLAQARKGVQKAINQLMELYQVRVYSGDSVKSPKPHPTRPSPNASRPGSQSPSPPACASVRSAKRDSRKASPMVQSAQRATRPPAAGTVRSKTRRQSRVRPTVGAKTTPRAKPTTRAKVQIPGKGKRRPGFKSTKSQTGRSR